MILSKLKLNNFRGYNNIELTLDSGMNVIIGRNDVGKSTILEALEIFFNAEKTKMDISDLCVYNDLPKITISCCFTVNEDKILIDSTNFTTCKDEFILNEVGLLEIKKEWDCSKGKLSASSQKTYITALYPSVYETPLLQEKIQTLQKMYDKYKADPIYIPENRTKSAELRKAIYSKELAEPFEKHLVDIDISKDDAKNIWDSISKQLPLYFLFESDRKNTDKDAEIQDPLKTVTKSVIADMESEIQKMQEEVKAKVEEIGKKTILKLAELDENIAKDIKPIVTLKPIDSSFTFDLVSDNNIPLNKRGSGIRRLILLSYFRADAEETLRENKNRQMIYAIEEPETSQHPDFQRMILDTLLDLSSKSTHQIIITSHTPEIAKMVEINQLIFIRKGEDGFPYFESDNTSKAFDIAKTLGILPYATTRTVIYVEGLNDVNILTNINQSIPELNTIIDLKSSEIAVIPLQGSRLVDWINKNYFDKSNITEIYIADNDVKMYSDLISEINQVDDGRRFGWTTALREMENYIPIELVEKEFDIDLTKHKFNWKQQDVPKLLIDLCLKNIIDTKEREKTIKMRMNGKLTKHITKSQLEECDVWEEIECWFKKIASINNGTYVKK